MAPVARAVTAAPAGQQLAKLTTPGGQANDQFGTGMATAGNVLVVGAPEADSGTGAAYVFTRSADSTWSPVAILTASDAAVNDYFGALVAIDGGTIVVGAPSATLSGHTDAGAAYVFTEPPGGWADEHQAAKLTEPSPGAFDQFGFSVAISGGTVVIGSYGTTVGGAATAGAAYVFTEPGAGWASAPAPAPAAELTASDAAAGAALGQSVAVDGSTVVAGAPYAVVNGNAGQGAVYVFTQPAGGWADEPSTDIQVKLTASDGTANANLGSTVAVAGRTVVAGASGATINGNASQGAVYVFTEPAGGWVDEPSTDIQAELTASDGAAGDYLDLDATDGTTVVAGTPDAAVDGHPVQGAVYVFTRPAGGWSDQAQATKITASDGAAGDSFGGSAAISGPVIAVGAAGASVGGNAQQGAVYLFGPLQPRPHLTLAALSSPRPRARLAPRSAVPVTAAIRYTSGPPIPASLAAQLAAACAVTVRATGAQRLTSHCMSYDGRAGVFSYWWRLGTRTGRVTLEVQLSYPYPASIRELVIVRGS